MPRKMKTRGKLTHSFQAKMIERAHERRANDPVMQAKIDAQAYKLIEERKRLFGENWREGSAIRIPAGYVDAD